jgi:hypothetical protein
VVARGQRRRDGPPNARIGPHGLQSTGWHLRLHGLSRAGLGDGWLGYDLIPMVKKTASIEEVLAAVEAARDKVMADEVKSLTKLGIPKAMAYQMIASRFHQKVGNQEEAEPDPFEGNATSWEEIG